MKRIEIEKQLNKLIPYWSKRLGVKLEEFGKDNRCMTLCASVNRIYRKNYFWYNTKRIQQLKVGRFWIVALVFHELAHLKLNALHNKMGRIKAEYLAESQMLVWLKRYYPKYYCQKINYERNWLKKCPEYNVNMPYYGKAFSKIKEYQNVLED